EEIVGSIENDDIQLVDDYVEFIKNYQGDTLVITGSLYFISEVKSKLDFEAL
ncbi:TPA: bifunctional folylpolyglutamate synthase/dihydrofolate synthase, partial [Staphylococcus aureus]